MNNRCMFHIATKMKLFSSVPDSSCLLLHTFVCLQRQSVPTVCIFILAFGDVGFLSLNELFRGALTGRSNIFRPSCAQ